MDLVDLEFVPGRDDMNSTPDEAMAVILSAAQDILAALNSLGFK